MDKSNPTDTTQIQFSEEEHFQFPLVNPPENGKARRREFFPLMQHACKMEIKAYGNVKR